MKLIHPGSKTANGYYLRQVIQGPFPFTAVEYWVKRLTHRELTDTDTSQTLSWDDFPTDVWLVQPGAHLWVVEAFEGGTTTDVDIIVGDAADDNGLVTISALDGVAADTLIRTAAAAEHPTVAGIGARYEAAFVPQAIVVSTAGNLNTLTTGEVDIIIPFMRNLTHANAT